MTDTLPGQAIDTLLTRLGTDDGFRRHFASQPAAALATLGIGFAASLGAAALAPVDGSADLADKSTFLAARDTLREQASKSPFTPITLDFAPRTPVA